METTSWERQPFFAQKKKGTQLFYLLFFLLCGLFFSSILSQLVAQLIWGDTTALEGSQLAHYYRFTQFLGAIGTWLFPALLYSFLSTRKIGALSHADFLPEKKSIGIVILLSISLLPIVSALSAWNEQWHLPAAFSQIETWMRNMEAQSESVLNVLVGETGTSSLLLNILILGALPAICEEFFFRGTLQPFLKQWSGKKHLSIWLTAFIFSAIHLQFLGFVPRFLLGAYLGYLFEWSGSIWLSTTAHFMHNSLSVLLVCLAARHGIDLDAVNLTEYWPIVLCCALLSCLLFIWLKKR